MTHLTTATSMYAMTTHHEPVVTPLVIYLMFFVRYDSSLYTPECSRHSTSIPHYTHLHFHGKALIPLYCIVYMSTTVH